MYIHIFKGPRRDQGLHLSFVAARSICPPLDPVPSGRRMALARPIPTDPRRCLDPYPSPIPAALPTPRIIYEVGERTSREKVALLFPLPHRFLFSETDFFAFRGDREEVADLPSEIHRSPTTCSFRNPESTTIISSPTSFSPSG